MPRLGRQSPAPELGTFLSIKHPVLKLASCCLLAASLLPACGGSSSTSASGNGAAGGGADSRTYQQGYAQGTAATLGVVLTRLQTLQAALAGTDAPAQSGGNTLGRAFASRLETRQRETLAMELLTFIGRLTVVRDAAAAAGAGADEAAAARAAADEALRALELVVAADTTEQATGTETAQRAAIEALRTIAAVPSTAPDARQRIDTALEAALEEAQSVVDRLQAELAAVEEQLGQQSGDQSVIAGLQQRLTAAEAERDVARANLNARTPRFGSPPAAPATRRASIAYHPRRTGVEMTFNPVSGHMFSPVPVSNWREGIAYQVPNFGAAVAEGDEEFFDLTPDPVVYSRTGGNRRVFAASNPNLSHFPGRGTVFRGHTRRTLDNNNVKTDNPVTGSNTQRIYQSKHRLVQQGQPHHLFLDIPDGDTRTIEENVDAVDGVPYTTFQYKPDAGFTMAFGGNGVAFADMERYAIKDHRKDCAAGAAVAAGGGSEFCNDATVANIEISFGEPQASPYDERGTNYWLVQVPSPRLEADTSPDFSVGSQAGQSDRIAGQDLGTYELFLSNYAGAEDDAHRYLSYAAYGLFKYNGASRLGRFSTFHYGVDSFGTGSPLPTDADGSFTGTFKGRTRGFIVTSRAPRNRSGWGNIETLYHLRGDLEMTAKIGVTADGNNRVGGKISNLQFAYGNVPGLWTQSGNAGIPHGIGGWEVRLLETHILENGSYSGIANPCRGSDPATCPSGGLGLFSGHYEGAFYGPAGAGMETAGTWWLPVNNADGGETVDGLVGSFGAVCTEHCTPGTPPPASP